MTIESEKRAAKVLTILEKEFPNAGTRLHFSTVFELLVATILSAQSTDEQVNHITGELFKSLSRPEDFAAMEPDELEPLIKGCGLYHNKARGIVEASRIILTRFHGQVPDTLEALMELPGVGRKTANVVIAVGFGKPGLGVDTHVHRVANRLGLASSKSADKTEQQLKAIIPPGEWGKAHHLLIWHGRAFCKAPKPKCEACPLSRLCAYRNAPDK